jgi:hypothetical protein
MDNQGWMPVHVDSSQLASDNLRLMQSMLSPRCILMGSIKKPERGRVTQGSVDDAPAAVRKRPGGWLRGGMGAMATMMLLLLAGLPGCMTFRAFDCNSQSSQIEQYSLLDPEPCGNMEKVHAIERELYGEIVQIKKERLVQVTRCTATETVVTRHCGWQSHSGPGRYAKFHDPITIEPAECRQAVKTGHLKLRGKDHPFEMNVRKGVSVELVGGLDEYGNCRVGVFHLDGMRLEGQMVTANYEIYVRQEWARANDLTGSIKLSEYLMGTTADRALVDSGEGTYVWEHSKDACPDTLVSLYRGRIKVLTNSTSSFTDGTAIVSGRDKTQVAGLELKETMILCGRAAQTTHIKSIAVFFHPMEQIEVASGKFNMVTTEAEFTRLESELSFLQVRSTMTLQETIRQVKAEICEDRKQIAHTRLESIAGAENPYSLMQVFGRGHLVTRNGATVYVTRCQAAEVVPRTHTNCTNEIPAVLNGTDVFVDPISFVVKAAAAPVRCNDVAPPRWRLNGRWYCAFPEIRDCAEPGKIPMKPVAIEDVNVMELGLGRSIYSPEQLEEFARFQESQGTRRAFLAESAERAYNTRVGDQWGSGLSDLATAHLVHAVGHHLVPLYQYIGPTATMVLIILFLIGIVRMLLDIVIRAVAITRVRGCGWWLMGAFWGTLFQIAVAPVQWAVAKGHNIGKKVSYQMTSEAARVEIEDSETQGLAGREMEDASAPRVQINNLDRLVTWSNEFLGRRDNDRVYPAPIIRGEPNIRSSASTVDMNVTEENERRQ